MEFLFTSFQSMSLKDKHDVKQSFSGRKVNILVLVHNENQFQSRFSHMLIFYFYAKTWNSQLLSGRLTDKWKRLLFLI